MKSMQQSKSRAQSRMMMRRCRKGDKERGATKYIRTVALAPILADIEKICKAMFNVRGGGGGEVG